MDHTRPVSIIPIAALFITVVLFLIPWHGAGRSGRQETAGGTEAVAADRSDRTRIADYDIQVTLDAANKRLIGRETITWLNADGPATSELKLHLYMNAFRSADTLMMAQRGDWLAEDAGWIDIKSVRLPGGTIEGEVNAPESTESGSTGWNGDLTDRIAIDETVMTLSLPRAVEAGERLRLEIEFEVQLPRIFTRSGYSKDFFFIGQWFPKVGVFSKGRWICDQYQRNTEFFSDFGRYRVEITTPKNYSVGATGTIESSRVRGRQRTLVFNAYPVHDFAWAASPDFRTVERELRYESEGRTRSIKLLLLMQRDRLDQAAAYTTAIQRALVAFGRDYGPFPYDRLTVVDPAPGRGQRAGGMEYPMLVTGGSSWVDTYLFPGGRQIERVTIHEFGHQYWYGAVANNEVDEPWIDEGLTTYSADKVIDSYAPFGENTRYPKIFADTLLGLHPFLRGWQADLEDFSNLFKLGMPSSTLVVRRSDYLMLPQVDPITAKADHPFSSQAYIVSAYSKPALALRTLEGVIGEEKVREILSAFYKRFNHSHPDGSQFRALASEIAGQDLSWFFDQVFDGTEKLDYAVGGIEVRQREEKFHSKVTALRRGGIFIPQTIRLTMEDGFTIDIEWERRSAGDDRIWMEDYTQPEGLEGIRYRLREGLDSRWFAIEMIASRPVTAAQIDPGYRYPLDTNFANNSYTLRANTAAATRREIGWTRLMGRWLHGISVFN